jgi:outer membrane lipoprotein-sorting protein
MSIHRSIIATLALLAIAGCGGGGGSTSAQKPSSGGSGGATKGEEAKSAREILADVSQALSGVQSYHAEGTQTDKDGVSHLVVDVSAAGDGRFKLDLGKQSTRLVVTGGQTYINANREFWVAHGGAAGPRVAQLLSDRWVKVPASMSADLTSTLDKLKPKTLAHCLTQTTGTVTKAGTASVDGKRVVVLTDDGDRPGGSPGRLYVATSGPALPVREMQTGPQRAGVTDRRCDDPSSTTTRSDVHLSGFDRPLKVTAPHGALDLGKLIGSGGGTTQS